MTQTFTNEQLEAWARLGPWHVGKSLCGYYPAITKDIHAGHNTNITGAVHGYMYHADQKADQANNAALIASAPTLAAALLAERKAREVEVGELRAAAEDLVSLCHADVKMNGTTYQPMPYRSAFTKAVEHMIEAITKSRQALKGPTP